ncbi:MAG: nucleotide exchange factor GrpE, partial [Synergistetes bacterium HGW-Synergistetes-2]
MSSVNDQVSSELEKEGVASASSGESVSGDEPEARQEAAPSPEELLAALQNAEREKIELTDALARARADFFNYRKRVDRDRQKERSMIAEEKALDFLPVLDNLDRALSVSPDIDGKSVLQGVAMVRKQFLAVLESMGVEAVPSIGSLFSP